MSLAAAPLVRIPVGVVVERRKAASRWIDVVWRAVGVLPDAPETPPWTMLREEGEATLFYAGSATIDFYRSETARYVENLASGSPGVWVILSPAEGAWRYAITAVTVDPSEGESFTEAADYLVESVPMPEVIREALEAFIAEHHVEREFVKRRQRRANPEALARREPGAGGE